MAVPMELRAVKQKRKKNASVWFNGGHLLFNGGGILSMEDCQSIPTCRLFQHTFQDIVQPRYDLRLALRIGGGGGGPQSFGQPALLGEESDGLVAGHGGEGGEEAVEPKVAEAGGGGHWWREGL